MNATLYGNDREIRGAASPRNSGLPVSRTARKVEAHVFGMDVRRRVNHEAYSGMPTREAGGGGQREVTRHGVLPWGATEESFQRLHLLIVDEDAGVRSACTEIARQMGFGVQQAADAAEAQAIVRSQRIDMMLLDLRVAELGGPDGRMGGLSLLEEVKAQHPQMTVVVMTASGSIASAVEVMRLGAADYLSKPFVLEELVTILERTGKRTNWNSESRALRERLRTQRRGGPLVGQSPEMEKLYRILSKVAHSSHPVLIQGETGTGKELVARSIHFNGPHASRRFIPVDCGAVKSALLEGELFGYVKGERPDLPGLCDAKDGLLATLDGGTVFLDEIGELSLELQAKLLRALQDKVVHPIGASHTVPITGRVLAATNADIAGMVEQGKFRRDLYFRLNVVSLRIPALRQRKEDIPELTQYFLDRLQRDTGNAYTFADEVLEVLLAYEWPGNVMELTSVIEHACAMASGPVIYLRDLPQQLQEVKDRLLLEANLEPLERRAEHIPGTERIQSIAEIERQAILGTIRHLRGDKLLAAKLLGIGKTTLYRKLKEYGVGDWERGL